MTEQHDEGVPPMDFGPGGYFLTSGEEFTVKIAGLSQEQSARVFALQQARLVLTPDDQTDIVEVSSSGGPRREWVRPAASPNVMDIYNLAVFILDGVDPWQEIQQQQATLYRVRTDPDGLAHAEPTEGDEGGLPGFD